jgi:hypothetical protein
MKPFDETRQLDDMWMSETFGWQQQLLQVYVTVNYHEENSFICPFIFLVLLMFHLSAFISRFPLIFGSEI